MLLKRLSVPIFLKLIYIQFSAIYVKISKNTCFFLHLNIPLKVCTFNKFVCTII
jgi:hypothetical protein